MPATSGNTNLENGERFQNEMACMVKCREIILKISRSILAK